MCCVAVAASGWLKTQYLQRYETGEEQRASVRPAKARLMAGRNWIRKIKEKHRHLTGADTNQVIEATQTTSQSGYSHEFNQPPNAKYKYATSTNS